MHRLAKQPIKALLRRAGYDLVPAAAAAFPAGWTLVRGDCCATEHTPPFARDRQFLAALDRLEAHACFNAERDGYPVWRLNIVWNAVRWCRNIAGDVVEFGSYRGGNAYIMHRSLELAGAARRVYLYDTFCGIPERSLTPREVDRGYVGRYCDTSVERVKKLLSAYASFTEFRPGVIPDTLHDDDGPDRIAFVHLDLNAAAATESALRWSHGRWSPGAVCVLDDYLWSGYEEQRAVVDAFLAEKSLSVIGLPTGQGLVINS
jgi:O-methyltransferase